MASDRRETRHRLIEEADLLAGVLRRRYLVRSEHDARLLRLCGRAEMRWLRRSRLAREVGDA